MAIELLGADRRKGPIEVIFMAQCQPVPSAKPQANSEYTQRIDRVIDYLRGNLHRPVKLAELANVACFS